LRHLIESNWLVTCRSLNVRDEQELQELDLLREMYIPEILFQLHTVLYVTRNHLPTNCEKSLQLCNLMVDERFQCYKEVMKCGKLSHLLDLLRHSSMAILEVSRSPFSSTR
jgi:nuclear pore complex protein Nup107